MRCDSCGRELPEDAAFCTQCGARTHPENAQAMALLAATSEVVKSARAASEERPGEVPEVPEPAEAADSVPEIPAAAFLPDGAGAEMTTEAMTSTGSATEGPPEEYIEAARLREEKRRAAQTILEAARIQLHEELEGLPEPDTMIWEQKAPREGGHLGMGAQQPLPPPPPPPPSAEERMWADTRERAQRHGVTMPPAPDETPGERARSPLQTTDATDEDTPASKCCAYGCVALFVLMFLSFLIVSIVRMSP